MTVAQSPSLLLAGDYFTDSSFSGCIRSGFAAATTVQNHLQAQGAKASQYNQEERADNSKGKGKGKSNKGKPRQDQYSYPSDETKWSNNWSGGKGYGGKQGGKGKRNDWVGG